MRYSQQFADAVKSAMGDRTYEKVGQMCALDHTTIWRMATTGRLPRRDTLTAFVNGLGITGRTRTELFRLAGFIADFDPARAEEVAA